MRNFLLLSFFLTVTAPLTASTHYWVDKSPTHANANFCDTSSGAFAMDATFLKEAVISTSTIAAVNTNADLAALFTTAGAISPTFAAATTSYNVNAIVPFTTASVTVTATRAQANATLQARVNGGSFAAVNNASASGALPLIVGNNSIDVLVTAQDGTTTKTYTITVTRAAGSANADLAALSTTAGVINPVFAAATTTYNVNVSVPFATASITVTPTRAQANATLQARANGGGFTSVINASASSALNLVVGSNSIDVLVTAQDGTTTKTYTITVTRAVASANADLSAFTTTAGAITPAFAAATTSYSASVLFATATTTVRATNATATLQVRVNEGSFAPLASNTPSSALNLIVGSNIIDVLVTAQDGTTTKTYTLTVTRAVASANADLSAFTTTAGAINPTFAAATTSYSASVLFATATTTVRATNATATLQVRVNEGSFAPLASNTPSSALNLIVGSNIIDLLVTAQDGTTTKTYTLTVTRAVASANADLSAFTTTAGAITPVFAAATTSYSASVLFATATITVRPTSAAAATLQVRINGGSFASVLSGTSSSALNLDVGSNTIDVLVTSQDDTTTKTYTLIVTRAVGNTNADLANFTTTAGAISPNFAAATTSYSAPNVAFVTASITVTSTRVQANATLQVRVNGGNFTAVTSGSASGALNLVAGSNIVEVLVTAQDGTTTKTYTLTVTRAAGSANADLSDLTTTAGALSPTFAAAITSYSAASVPFETTSITITPTRAQPNATLQARLNNSGFFVVSSGSASFPLNLVVGSNTIDVLVTAQDGTTTKTYTLTVTRAASTNANLSALTTTAGIISPAFAAATTSYSASVPFVTTSITVTPTRAQANATLQVRVNEGNFLPVTSGFPSSALPLAVGSNTIDVLVTAQDGTTTKTYTLTVTRAAGSANADLSDLTTTAGTLSPTFAAAITSYSAASVPFETTSITITPTRAQPNATLQARLNNSGFFVVSSGSASFPLNLVVGSNTIDVLVTAQDGTTTKTYTLTVIRAASTNANLSALTTTAGAISPVFAQAITSYSASVPFVTTSITVTASRAQVNATLQVRVNEGNFASLTTGFPSTALPLAVGSNTIDVLVTAQDGTTTKTYTLTVTRVAASTNADLSGLSTTAGALSPTFAAVITSYSAASVSFETQSITVTPTTAQGNATLQARVNGGSFGSIFIGFPSSALNLVVGSNTIDVLVTAQDGTTTKTYTLTVARAASTNANLSALTTTAGTISPAFAAATTSYSASVPFVTTSITVTPTRAQANATLQVRINGGFFASVANSSASSELPLAVGINTIDVLVTAQDNTTTKTYTLTVIRAAASTNADLSGLTTTAGAISPSFSAAITSYSATSVPFGTVSITVTPTIAQGNATLQARVNEGSFASIFIGFQSSPLNLVVGSNTIDVLVTAQDGTTTKAYTLTVTRAASTNANLSDLTTTAGAISPAFAAATTSYNVNAIVPFATASITVTPTIAQPNATLQARVNGGDFVSVTSASASSGLNLVVGSNSIDVLVTAQDGTTTRTYTISVVRAAASTNADLAGLNTTAGAISPTFAAATTSYNVNAIVPFATASITVTSFLAQVNATLQARVNGGSFAAVNNALASSALDLAVGSNTVDVLVTAQDGTTTKTYTILITRAVASANADLSNFTTTAGTITPAFAAATTSYSVSVLFATVSTTVRATNTTATLQVRVNGGIFAPVTSNTPSSALILIVGSNTIDVLVTAQDGIATKTYTLIVTRAVATTDANLSNFTTTAGVITPAFAAATTSYSASVLFATASTRVRATNATATLQVRINEGSFAPLASNTPSSDLNLVVGSNIIEVLVTAEDGTTTQTYTLTVTRAVISANADLAAFTTTAGAITPVFAAATTSYSASVLFATASITVRPTSAQVATRQVSINGGSFASVANSTSSSPLNLIVGINTIQVLVTAEDGTTTQTYTLTVTREIASANADLSAFTTTAGVITPAFAAATTNYSASVLFATATTTVRATNATATLQVRVNAGIFTPLASNSPSLPLDLVVGSNIIEVLVTSEDSTTTQTYTLTVTREIASANADLSAFTTTAGIITPTFEAAITGYSASVLFATVSTTVRATRAQINATLQVRVNGNSFSPLANNSPSNALPLIVGSNSIDVLVTAQDGTTTKTYTLTVTRAASSIADLEALAISVGTLSPTFAAATTAYTAAVSDVTTSITVTPTVAQANATIIINGNVVTSGGASAAINLTVGTNTINTIVTAQDGTTTKTYTITVTRAPGAPESFAQSFCEGAVINDLLAQGTNLKWYTAATGGTALPSATVLTTGTFFVSQTVNEAEGERTSVAITINPNIWLGTTSAAWDDAANWSCGSIPISSEAIVIATSTPNAANLNINFTVDAGKTLTLSDTGSLTVAAQFTLTIAGTADFGDKAVVFKSNATGSGSLGPITGTLIGATNVTTERFIPAKRAFRFLSPSVTTTSSINANWQENAGTAANLGTHITGTGGVSNGFDASTTNNASLFVYTSGSWQAVTNTNTDTLTAGTGYRLMVRGDRTVSLASNTPIATPTVLRATGTLKIGDHSATINQTADGFSFVGNPYQAPVNIIDVLTASTNINTGFVFYWDPTINVRGGYITRNLIANTNNVTSNFNEFVQAGQAVFVRKLNNDDVATLTFTEANKSVANATAGLFRTNTTSSNSTLSALHLKLKTTVGNQLQEVEGVLALFDPSYSWDVNEQDAPKLSNLDEQVSFKINNQNIAIASQSIPVIANELPIDLRNFRQANYQWHFELENYNGATPYLFDTQNQSYTEIQNGTSYNFSVNVQSPSSYAARFKVVFANNSLSNPSFDKNIVLYPNPAVNGNNQFFIQGIEPTAKVTIYNILGQPIAIQTTELGNGLQVRVLDTIATGIYVVTVTTPTTKTQVKWIVK